MKDYKKIAEKAIELNEAYNSLVSCFDNEETRKYYSGNFIKINKFEKELAELNAGEEDKIRLITDDHRELRDIVLDESKKGNVVYASFEGLHVIALDDILKQPINGLLYDLNRDVATVLTFIDDPKWVNDFAVCSVITELHKRVFNE